MNDGTKNNRRQAAWQLSPPTADARGWTALTSLTVLTALTADIVDEIDVIEGVDIVGGIDLMAELFFAVNEVNNVNLVRR
ncbi:MAG: hypothetical protein RJB11_319, partial [Planctomycetota bacterium]